MPHIVMQSPDFRQAVVDGNRVSLEPYQGVRFIEGPNNYRLGETAVFKLDLM